MRQFGKGNGLPLIERLGLNITLNEKNVQKAKIFVQTIIHNG